MGLELTLGLEEARVRERFWEPREEPAAQRWEDSQQGEETGEGAEVRG